MIDEKKLLKELWKMTDTRTKGKVKTMEINRIPYFDAIELIEYIEDSANEIKPSDLPKANIE